MSVPVVSHPGRNRQRLVQHQVAGLPQLSPSHNGAGTFDSGCPPEGERIGGIAHVNLITLLKVKWRGDRGFTVGSQIGVD